ncbi:aryl hydrocarbon receptor-like isoform X2 [Phyllopteryx taeniolatus]|uniref:aryl hydrocarbon receptor-like isoform X2 n=1 Tax=Phyllopteryx taeniolatus TaxID=161469 RepID=UPI002AD3117F|nr:aryl hydrocarbon receptor-like isoform X2 [Phyllopteryx taeniolatus]
MYAGRKRRKPFQKGTKISPTEGDKSNPSKRHRDRLNLELDRLASLLPFPEDVISNLDKLSILRLCVSYIRAKRFFSVALKKHLSSGVSKSTDQQDGKVPEQTARCMPEGELLLQALSGFVLVITAEGIIFYCSHTIQDYLGFHQTDVMHQSVLELIHAEDQQEFKRNLHWALNPPEGRGSPLDTAAEGESGSSSLVSYNPDELPPENSSFLERSFVCRFRCLLDNSSGFLAMSIQGRLKFLHGQSGLQWTNEQGAPLQLALFAIATPLQSPAILEIRTKSMIFRTKHKLDFTPMACDAKGKIVLGYTEAELRVRGSGYQFIHAADMLHCAENHVRMIKTGESGLTVFRLLTKDNRWKWVQANARLVYKNGKPDYIIATQRPLVDEEGGEHLKKRSMHLPFTFATGEALLYQTGYPLYGFPENLKGKAKCKRRKMEKKFSEDMHPKSLLEALMSQDHSVYVCQPDSEAHNSYACSTFSKEQGETSGFGDSWQMTGSCNRETSMCDPLLATLDSLSLDGEETCSNSELLIALENLGLNAEDLELLLLDEKMIQVEMDSSHFSTLSELTNNEILSYIHESLEMGSNREQHNDIVGFGLYNRSPNSSESANQQVQAHCVPTHPTTPSINGQMQQLPISAGGILLPSGSVEASRLSGKSQWMLYAEKAYHSDSHTPLHPLVNGENKDISPLESSHPWQPGNSQTLLPDSQSLERTFRRSKHTTFLQNALVDPVVSNIPHAGSSALNGTNVCHYEHLVDTAQPHTLQGQQSHKLQSPALYPCLAQCSQQSAAMEQEQLVALTQPSVDAYSLFNTTNTTRGAHNQLPTSLTTVWSGRHPLN